MSQYPAILYVEDDALSRMVLDILLRESMGLSNVVIFEDSQDFLERIEVLPFIPDIILLDIHMKPINGFQMLELLREHATFSPKPIIALTASVMNEEVEKLRHAGFDGVLAKPLDEMTFPKILSRLLNGDNIWTVT